MTDIKYALPLGAKLKSQNEYTITKILGQGGFGITYIATAQVKVGNIPVNANFAIKEFFLNGKCKRANDCITLIPLDDSFTKEIDKSLQDFIVEGERINKLCRADEHIVNVNEVFTANNTAYFVMEYIDGGNLKEYVERKGALSEKEAKEIILPIATAIGKMHEEHILHLDIKPENIMIKWTENGRISPIIIDFGIAMHFDKQGKATTKSKNENVSDGFAPTEQYGPITHFSPKVDVYALGATMFYMLVGNDPQISFDVSTEYLESNLNGISDVVKTAIIHAMALNKSDRTANTKEFLAELSADWPHREALKPKVEDNHQTQTKSFRTQQQQKNKTKKISLNEDSSLIDKIKGNLMPISGIALVVILIIGAALTLPGQCSTEVGTLLPNDSINKDSIVAESDSLTAKELIQDTIVKQEPVKPVEPVTETPRPTVDNNTKNTDNERLAKEKQDAQAKAEAQKKAEEQAKAKAEAQRIAEEKAAKAKIEAQKQAEEQKARNAKIQNKVKQAYSAAHSGDAATAKRLVNEITAEGGEWRAKGQAMKNEFKALGVYDFD